MAHMADETHILTRESEQKPAFRWAFYMVLLLAVAHLGIYQNTDFIYFQF